MKNSNRAEEVFKDFSEDIKSKIFEAAQGKLVYFPKNQNKQRKVNQEEVLVRYALSKKSYSEIGDELGVTKVRICQIVNAERRRFSTERVKFWKKRGLSLREIAKLYKKSHERIRQL